MKLGICYNLFDGEELLEPNVKNVRKFVDYISVIFQKTSYFGNTINFDILYKLHKDKLIDDIIEYKNDLSLNPKINEVNIRNLGLSYSIKNNCSYHISADIDEFYEDLTFVKKEIKKYDSAVVYLENYFKEPTFQITPSQNHIVTFIHSTNLFYQLKENYPYKIDLSRRLNNYEKCRVFNKEEFIIHHYSYVRKNINFKIDNSLNWLRNKNNFKEKFHNYQVGNILNVPPDFNNRRTKIAKDIFNLKGLL